MLQKLLHINEYARGMHLRLARYCVLCSVLMSLVSCMSPLINSYVTHEKTIDMGGYTVDRPSEGEWEAVVTAKEKKIEFSKSITDGDGNTLSMKSIMVKAQWAKDKNIWLLSEQEIAKRYLDGERFRMKLFATLGTIKIEDEKDETIYVDGMKLYNGYIKHSSTIGDVVVEMSMYIYFPTGYKDDDKFIIFLVSEGYKPKRTEQADLSIVFPVIKSLQVDRYKLNE